MDLWWTAGNDTGEMLVLVERDEERGEEREGRILPRDVIALTTRRKGGEGEEDGFERSGLNK